MEEGNMVIVDRYVYSNIAFQCAKIHDPGDRERLLRWIFGFEFGYNRLPRPDLNIFLNVPFAFTRKQLMGSRDGDDRAYLKGEQDIHEENLDFQERVRQVYLDLQHKVDDLVLIECMDGKGGMLPPQTISEKIITLIQGA
jgi:dTMP kinase